MKTSSRIITAVGVAAFAAASTSCMTTYDAYGRPVQSVDPGTAAAGAVAAGALGYAIGQNNDDRHYHYYHGYRRPYYGYRRSYHRWR
jgi:exo-beta-1,3-glucanase (GH17 family)